MRVGTTANTDDVNQAFELMEDEKFKTKFANAKKVIFSKKSKVLSGQQFLIKKLSKARVDNSTDYKIEKVSSSFKLQPVRPPKSDVARYQLVALIPELVLPLVDKKSKALPPALKKGAADTDKVNSFLYSTTEEEYYLRLFSVDMCALLRIIYNGCVLGVKNDVVLELLNNKGFMKQILRACNHAGWDKGLLSSKYLRLVNMSVTAGADAANNDGALFEGKISYYSMIFKSLANIMDYFLQKFKKENIKNFSEKEVNLLYEIVKTAFTTMMSVKNNITTEFSADSEALEKEGEAGEKLFYDIYSDKASTPLQEIMRWVMTAYIPPRFIEVFVEVLCRIEARVQSIKFELKCRLVNWLIELISEYLSIFPGYRFDVIKHFHEVQEIEGIKVRASLMACILKKSFFSSKMQRVEEYMNTEEAGKGHLKDDKHIMLSSHCFMVEGNKRMFPIFLILTKSKGYLLKQTLEKPSPLTGLDSLSPYPPECFDSFEMDDLSELFQNVDRTSVRFLFKSHTTFLIDFMSEFEKDKMIFETIKISKSKGAGPDNGKEESPDNTSGLKVNEMNRSLKLKMKDCDYIFNVAIYEFPEENDNRTFTDVCLNQNKHMMLIMDKSLKFVIPDFSEASYKKFEQDKTSNDRDSMFPEVESLYQEVDAMKVINFPNLETSKVVFPDKSDKYLSV